MSATREGSGRGLGRRRVALLLTLALALALGAGAGGPDIPREYQLKAVFLYNFAHFTEWPAAAFPDAGSPLGIGILGRDPFGTYLDETVRGEAARGRRMLVERYRQVDEIRNCHILYVSQSETRRLESIVRSLKGRPVLTVSDIPGAAQRGAMIEWVTAGNRLRLRINLETLRAAGLNVSSQLLRAAEVIPGEKRS